MRRPVRRFAALAALALVALTLAAASTGAESGARDWPKGGAAPVAITVEASPLTAFHPGDATETTFGGLRFRGGLVLSSPFEHFGGLSALRLDADGRGFLAVSDRGHWIAGQLVYRDGSLAGLRDVVAAPLLDEAGRPITARGWYDAESLARGGSIVRVGLERVHRILEFDFSAGGLAARGRPIVTPPAMQTLPPNRGIEALVALPGEGERAGALLALSERGLDADGNIRGFLIGGPAPGSFTVRRTDAYDISDAALLPGGDGILVLERKASLRDGIGVRIRRLARADIVAGAVVDGPTVFEADLGYEIDNFEGIDAHRTAEGETVITLLSDDNFSFFQRTLLMQFTLLEP